MKSSVFIFRNSGRILTIAAIVIFSGCGNDADNPRVIKLENDDIVLGQRFPAGTIINLTKNGESIKYCQLPYDYVIQGHKCIGKMGSLRWKTVFYPNGVLASIGLANTEVIDGIPCATGNFWNETFGKGGRTDFYDNGRLKYAKVAKKVIYRGRTIKQGQYVRLNRDGSIDSIK